MFYYSFIILGTCVPVVFSVVLFRMLNLLQCKIVFIESFCRVQKYCCVPMITCRLSVTGTILYTIADSFIVQWPQLQAKYRRSIYLGILM